MQTREVGTGSDQRRATRPNDPVPPSRPTSGRHDPQDPAVAPPRASPERDEANDRREMRDVTRAIARALGPGDAAAGPGNHSALDALSHELRTPITTIYGGSRVLRRARVSEEVRIEVADAVASEAERLYRVVEDLLAVARTADRSSLRLEPVLLQRVVPRVVEELRDAFGPREVRLDLPAEVPAALADYEATRHVVRNLALNAARFGRRGGVVAIVLAAAGEDVELHVIDDGPGVDPNERGLLFEPFYRSRHGDPRTQGAGLGLAACRGLAEAMHGAVWAAERAGGAEFVFRLPRARD